MRTSLQEARSRLVANVGTNVLSVGVSVAIGIWLTPYLISNLSIEVYGMIPLVTSFIQYLNLFTMSISGTVSRYVSIYFNSGDLEKSNIFFSSALIGLVVICGVLLIPVLTISLFFSDIFKVPTGFEIEASVLFLCVMVSSFLSAMSTSFQVSTFVRHRFDLANAITILSKLLRVVVLLFLFEYIRPSLISFGISYSAMALFFLVSFVLLTRILTPQLHIRRRFLEFDAIRQMAKMSTWMAVNQIGAILYIGVSFILINIFLGPEQLGRYGAIAQLVILMTQLGAALSNVFVPIAYDYIARDKIDVLVIQMQRSAKFMSLMMGLPIGIVCGLAKPFLTLWLGTEYSDLAPLVWLLMGPWLVSISIRPIFSVFQGLNKVKIPAIVTMVLGLVNVLLTIILIRFTGLGINGVALALLICLAGKNLFFSPVYAASITGQKKTMFIKALMPGIIIGLIIAMCLYAFTMVVVIDGIALFVLIGLITSALYSTFSWFIILSKEEKLLLSSLLLRHR